MPMIPSLDIIVLTYNRAELFEKTLRSVCDQTYPDFTVKVLNNGSTDNTEEVFNKVKAEYPQRKFDYLKLEENHLDQYLIDRKIEFITADYVIVFHDDDLMHPRYVEHLMKIIPEHPEFVILGGKTKQSEHPEDLEWDEPTGKYIVGDMCDMVKWYFKGDSISFPAVCYKSHWYKNTKFRSDLYGNRGDLPFVLDIAEHGKVCRLEDRFLHYRKSEKQNSVQMPPLEKRKNFIKKIADILLNGSKKHQDVFYKGLNMLISNGYIDYETALSEGWIRFSEKNGRSSGKIYAVHLLKYVLYSFLSLFPSKKSLHFKEKAKKHRLKSFCSTKIYADKSNEIRIRNSHLNITVDVKGKNNKITICSTDNTGKINIKVVGDNNVIFIGNITVIGQVDIQSCCSNGEINIPYAAVIKNLTLYNGYGEQAEKITGGKIFIGENTNFSSAFIFNPHSNAHINIGKRCMFSDDISIRNTDGHPIFDAETNECLNKVSDGNGIDIGDHVWVGFGATILKNAKVPDDSVVGTQAVVTKQFSEPNVVIAGTPAKIIKSNITWKQENDDFFNPTRKAEQ